MSFFFWYLQTCITSGLSLRINSLAISLHQYCKLSSSRNVTPPSVKQRYSFIESCKHKTQLWVKCFSDYSKKISIRPGRCPKIFLLHFWMFYETPEKFGRRRRWGCLPHIRPQSSSGAGAGGPPQPKSPMLQSKLIEAKRQKVGPGRECPKIAFHYRSLNYF